MLPEQWEGALKLSTFIEALLSSARGTRKELLCYKWRECTLIVATIQSLRRYLNPDIPKVWSLPPLCFLVKQR